MIDEAVLLRPFGSINATINQLKYLRRLIKTGTLQLQVIPGDGPIAHRGQTRFELLEFDHPDAPPVVVSHLTGCPPESLHDPAEVEQFRALATRLADAATPATKTTVILDRAIDRLRKGPQPIIGS